MVCLAFEFRHFILDSEFLALELGDLLIRGSGVGESIFQFRFQGPVFGREFTEMRLNIHQCLQSELKVDNNSVT
jgi:hypothetical protein